MINGTDCTVDGMLDVIASLAPGIQDEGSAIAVLLLLLNCCEATQRSSTDRASPVGEGVSCLFTAHLHAAAFEYRSNKRLRHCECDPVNADETALCLLIVRLTVLWYVSVVSRLPSRVSCGVDDPRTTTRISRERHCLEPSSSLPVTTIDDTEVPASSYLWVAPVGDASHLNACPSSSEQSLSRVVSRRGSPLELAPMFALRDDAPFPGALASIDYPRMTCQSC